jgi:asparagine synthase (glutamine-hydrolysing)
VPALIDAFDEPFADSSAIPVYFLSRFARTHVKVVLSGEGGDEIFGGYETYVASKLAAGTASCPRSSPVALIPNLVDRLPVSHRRVSFDYKAKRFVRGALRGAAGSHLAWKELFSEDAKAELWAARTACRRRRASGRTSTPARRAPTGSRASSGSTSTSASPTTCSPRSTA